MAKATKAKAKAKAPRKRSKKPVTEAPPAKREPILGKLQGDSGPLFEISVSNRPHMPILWIRARGASEALRLYVLSADTHVVDPTKFRWNIKRVEE